MNFNQVKLGQIRKAHSRNPYKKLSNCQNIRTKFWLCLTKPLSQCSYYKGGLPPDDDDIFM